MARLMRTGKWFRGVVEGDVSTTGIVLKINMDWPF
jgi:hypothetical protein